MGKHGADVNLAVTLDAVPHTVLGTHAGQVSRQSWRTSTCLRLRRRRGAIGAAVPVRRLSRPGADLQLLRPRANLLRWRLCRAGGLGAHKK